MIGALRPLLLPMASVKDITTIPGELFAKFQTGFYAGIRWMRCSRRWACSESGSQDNESSPCSHRELPKH